MEKEPHRCGTPEDYNEWYDAYFCSSCDEWTEAPCKAVDPHGCGFDCRTRPEKPSQVVRPGEGHVYDDGSRSWPVDKLIEAAAHLVPEELPVGMFTEMNEVRWGSDLTVRDVMEHARRIYEADLSCPVIVSVDGKLMDGCHRLVKAVLEGHETIKAVRFLVDPPPLSE